MSDSSKERNYKPEYRDCAHVDYEPIRFGVLTGVLIGGTQYCHCQVIPPEKYCYLHRDDAKKKKEHP
jgi:hypothetical protein